MERKSFLILTTTAELFKYLILLIMLFQRQQQMWEREPHLP